MCFFHERYLFPVKNLMENYSDIAWKYLPVPTLTGKGKSGNHHQLAYTDWGDPNNKHVVICVHGLTRNCRDFDFLASTLAKDFRVICVDMAGRGRSDWLKNTEDYGSPLIYLSDMEHVLGYIHSQNHNNERVQLYWVGISMGGLIGMLMAARRRAPVAFRALVMSDIGPFIPSRVLTQFAIYVGKDPRFSNLDELEAYMRNISSSYNVLTDMHWRHLALYSAREYKDGTIGFCYDPGISASFRPENIKDINLWAYWDKLALPVLVLRGEKSDILLLETSDEMQLRGPGAHIIELAGIGHAPMLMDTEQIQLVRNFLLKFKSHTKE